MLLLRIVAYPLRNNADNTKTQQAQGPKTPQPIRTECTEWVQTWYALGTLIYALGYYGGVCTMCGVSTEWVRTEGGWDDNIGLNRCRINF